MKELRLKQRELDLLYQVVGDELQRTRKQKRAQKLVKIYQKIYLAMRSKDDSTRSKRP